MKHRLQGSIATALLFVVAATPAARSQTVIGSVVGAVPANHLGDRLAFLGDVDGDGIDDLLAGDYADPTFEGNVNVVSGKTLTVLYKVPGSDPGDFQTIAAGLGDITGDGIPDFLAGAPNDFPGPDLKNAGSVRVCSGADGAVVATLLGSKKNARFGSALAGPGDTDGDGVGDIVVGAPGQGAVYVYSGATLALHRVLLGDGGPSSGVGGLLCGAGDIDGDGLQDIAVWIPEQHAVRFFSGLDGTVLLQANQFGYDVAALAPVGDVDADGHLDFAAGSPGKYVTDTAQGQVVVFSGTTGATLHVFSGVHSDDHLGASVCAAGDIDGDGHADIAMGAPGAWGSPSSGQPLQVEFGFIVVRSGATGKELVRFRGDHYLERLGEHLVASSRMNDDGFPDLVASTSEEGFGGLMALTGRYSVNDVTPSTVFFKAPGTIALTGARFEPDSPISVTIGGLPAGNVTWVAPDYLSCEPQPGIEDAVEDVVYEQKGLKVVVPAAIRFEGLRVFSVSPDTAPIGGGGLMTISGRHFVNDGSLQVTVFFAQATDVLVHTESLLTAKIPAYQGPNTPFIVQVHSSNGSDGTNDFKYPEHYLTQSRGGLQGGTVTTVDGISPHSAGVTKVFLGGVEATLIQLTPSKITFATPPFPEATGNKVGISIEDPVKGHEGVNNAFTYTPVLRSTLDPQGFAGGTVTLTWITDPAATATQYLSLWLGNPATPPVNLTLPGYAGILHEIPYVIAFGGLPEQQGATTLTFHLPPQPPSLYGVTLRMQSLVTGEGGPHGSFTNVVSFALP